MTLPIYDYMKSQKLMHEYIWWPTQIARKDHVPYSYQSNNLFNQSCSFLKKKK